MNLPGVNPENEKILPFATPQRESEVGVILHFFHLLFRQVRNWFFLFFLFFIFIKSFISSFLLAVALIMLFLLLFFVGLGIFAYLKYEKLLFHINYDTSEFYMESGVLQKDTQIFKLDRIQQVNINRSWMQRILGLATLEIDLAGAKGKEVKLKTLAAGTAEALRAELMHLRGKEIKSEDTQENPAQAETISSPELRISLLSLLKYSLVENPLPSLALIFIPLNYFYQNLSNFFESQTEMLEEMAGSATAIQALMFVLFLLLAAIVLNVVRSVLRFYNFRLNKQNEELKISHGLLNTRSLSIRPQRIQLLHIQQNRIQERWDVSQYHIKQFDSLEGKGANTLFSGLKSNQISYLRELLHIPTLEGEPMIIRPSKIMYHIYALIYNLILLIVLGTLIFYLPGAKLWLLIPVAAPLLYFWAYKVYQNYSLELYPGYIIKKSGFWNRKQSLLNIYKIQNVDIKQYIWQRKNAILTFSTAGGFLTFRFTDKAILEKIQNHYLYEIESNPKKWM